MKSAIPEFPLEGLASRAFVEFGDAADYFWKSMRLVESELQLEVEKARKYFPITGDKEKDVLANRLRKVRWRSEHKKITSVFTYLIATGNLFTCASLFENYILMLCKEETVWIVSFDS